MPKKVYIVDLTDAERAELLAFVKHGQHAARKLNRARILLLADEGHSDRYIARALHTGQATVQRTRQRFVAGNLPGALHEKRRPDREKVLDEKGLAVLESIATSTPPTGRKRWTVALVAERLVELQVVERISDETVRQALKKNGLS